MDARIATAAVLCLYLAASGCAPAAGVAIMSSSAGAATGAGIERTMGGKQHKTFVEPLAEVEGAARTVIERMALSLEETEDTDDGRKFKARADNRRIEIDLERLTPTMTRMTVLAKRHASLFSDEATATEIILQIARAIEDVKKS